MERVVAIGFLGRVIIMTGALGLSAAATADDFITDFDSQSDVNPAGTFTVTDGALNVRFEGGTVFTAGVGALYRSGAKSWMVDPEGVRNSTGTANAILSEGAARVTLYGRTQSGAVTARVRVLDEADVVIQDTNLTSADWTEITVNRGSGQSLIGTVRVENMSGGTTNDLMAAIEDFEFSTDAAGLGDGDDGEDDSDGTATGPLALLLLGLGWLLGRVNRRR